MPVAAIVDGHQGCGKSTLAEWINENTPMVALDLDDVTQKYMDDEDVDHEDFEAYIESMHEEVREFVEGHEGDVVLCGLTELRSDLHEDGEPRLFNCVPEDIRAACPRLLWIDEDVETCVSRVVVRASLAEPRVPTPPPVPDTYRGSDWEEEWRTTYKGFVEDGLIDRKERMERLGFVPTSDVRERLLE